MILENVEIFSSLVANHTRELNLLRIPKFPTIFYSNMDSLKKKNVGIYIFIPW